MYVPRLYELTGYCNQETWDFLTRFENNYDKEYWRDVLEIDNTLPWGVCRKWDGTGNVKMFNLITRIKHYLKII